MIASLVGGSREAKGSSRKMREGLESSWTPMPCSSRNAAWAMTSSREMPNTTVSSFANSASRSLNSTACVVQAGVPSRG